MKGSRLLNVNSGCAAIPNANVEIWHVDAAGDYSQYGTQRTQTFLRGIQTAEDRRKLRPAGSTLEFNDFSLPVHGGLSSMIVAC